VRYYGRTGTAHYAAARRRPARRCQTRRSPTMRASRCWRGEPFLAVKMQDPTWTRDRWEAAQAELAQWRLRQAQQRRSLRALGERLGEAAEDEADLERCEADETA